MLTGTPVSHLCVFDPPSIVAPPRRGHEESPSIERPKDVFDWCLLGVGGFGGFFFLVVLGVFVWTPSGLILLLEGGTFVILVKCNWSQPPGDVNMVLQFDRRPLE